MRPDWRRGWRAYSERRTQLRNWPSAYYVLRSGLKGLSAHHERRSNLEGLIERGERRSDLGRELSARRVLRSSSNSRLSARSELRSENTNRLSALSGWRSDISSWLHNDSLELVRRELGTHCVLWRSRQRRSVQR